MIVENVKQNKKGSNPYEMFWTMREVENEIVGI